MSRFSQLHRALNPPPPSYKTSAKRFFKIVEQVSSSEFQNSGSYTATRGSLGIEMIDLVKQVFHPDRVIKSDDPDMDLLVACAENIAFEAEVEDRDKQIDTLTRKLKKLWGFVPQDKFTEARIALDKEAINGK